MRCTKSSMERKLSVLVSRGEGSVLYSQTIFKNETFKLYLLIKVILSCLGLERKLSLLLSVLKEFDFGLSYVREKRQSVNTVQGIELMEEEVKEKPMNLQQMTIQKMESGAYCFYSIFGGRTEKNRNTPNSLQNPNINGDG